MFRAIPGRFGPVISARSRFGPRLFRPGSFRPLSFRPILVGRFCLSFFKSPRLRIISRTIIGCLMKSLVMSKAFFLKSLQVMGDRQKNHLVVR